ncbi:MAG: hypothetical protein U1A24_06880 [Cypionkella sp.]|uniref:hypothetical protein n=1 Tax=Cypionkella sp. TaxID=2811411 RepID=UPI002AB96973|nr:hypothetical protein [Cypionkella sp.]MDZ4310263.1 hypothetical protein [Cypionkella sp.]
MKRKRRHRQTVPDQSATTVARRLKRCLPVSGNQIGLTGFVFQVECFQPKETAMKGIVAYFLGIPIVVIILLYVTGIF